MEWRNNIDIYIKKSGRSKRFIAKKLSISENQLLAWRKGESFPPVNKAMLLAELLDCDVYDLFERKGEE
ncbi:helix-turn-helix domain-containing protein [Priestia flexa]|uniref:helix-turn-helix domain-containing protein n=1 Tax=Priestia flexa TaxID=86664 RepID=UPI002490EDF5|nr:helix-turn-helix transcriptional regulator [Priestia flexa]